MPTGMWLYAYLALWIVLAIEAMLLVVVIRQIARLYEHWARSEAGGGLPLEALAPAVGGRDLLGRPVSLGLSSGRKTLVLFLSPKCGTCQGALKGAMAQQPLLNGVLLLLVITAEEARARLFVQRFTLEEKHPDVIVLADPKRNVASRYKVGAVPYAVVVDEEGHIGAAKVGVKEEDIPVLIDAAADRRLRRLGRVPEAPPDLDGHGRKLPVGAGAR